MGENSLAHAVQHARDAWVAWFYTPAALKTFDGGTFTCLRKCEKMVGEFTITVVVIGESDFVTIHRSGKLVFVELIACVDLSDEKSDLAPDHVAPMSRHAVSSDPLTHECLQVCAEVRVQDRVRTGVRHHDPRGLNGYTDLIRVEHTFPAERTGAYAPRTMVLVGTKKNHLAIQSLHEYMEGDRLEPLTSLTRVELSRLVLG